MLATPAALQFSHAQNPSVKRSTAFGTDALRHQLYASDNYPERLCGKSKPFISMRLRYAYSKRFEVL
jgi:hypothetical protein